MVVGRTRIISDRPSCDEQGRGDALNLVARSPRARHERAKGEDQRSAMPQSRAETQVSLQAVSFWASGTVSHRRGDAGGTGNNRLRSCSSAILL